MDRRESSASHFNPIHRGAGLGKVLKMHLHLKVLMGSLLTVMVVVMMIMEKDKIWTSIMFLGQWAWMGWLWYGRYGMAAELSGSSGPDLLCFVYCWFCTVHFEVASPTTPIVTDTAHQPSYQCQPEQHLTRV